MNNYSITKAMIDATVAHGIKEMAEDPHRSVRRLADLGRRFSRSGFHEFVFSIMQELLANEKSAYYDMVANLLRNSNEESLRVYGVNTGYMSWTYGAREIRKYQAEHRKALPVSIQLRYDPSIQDKENALTVSDIAAIVRQGEKLGIYTYYIRQIGDLNDDYGILSVFGSFRDSAFTWMRPNGRLTAAQIQLLNDCRNVCTILPAGDTETYITASFLRTQKILYAIYALYNDVNREQVFHDLVSEGALTSEAALCFLVQEDGAKADLADLCRESRNKQELPCFLIDYYRNAASLSNMTVQHPYVLEIGTDRTILSPDADAGRLNMETPLEEELGRIMPALTEQGSLLQ